MSSEVDPAPVQVNSEKEESAYVPGLKSGGSCREGWSRPWGLALAMSFLVIGCFHLNDYGTTWDENESDYAGTRNLSIVRAVVTGESPVPWPFHEIPGYHFVFDTLRTLFAIGANWLFFEPGSRLGFHLFNLIQASGCLWLFYRLVLELKQPRATAVLAVVALAAFPKFLAHSQNNPKDSIGLFCSVLCALLVVRAARRPMRHSVAAGLGLGLALANHITSVFVVPIAALWLLDEAEGPWRRRFLRLLVTGSVAALTTLICWPWLWAQPVERLLWTVKYVTGFKPNVPVLYMGTVYAQADTPWHYSLVLLAVSTPLILLVGTIAGGFQIRAGINEARPARLALIWLAVFLIADLLAQSHYDGVRHVLPVLPPLALLAAVGIRWLWTWTFDAHRAVGFVLRAALVGGGLMLVVDLARMHPYHDAYLGEVVRPFMHDEPERWLELEVWGTVYKEGAQWLAEHAEPGAAVVVPMAPHCAKAYLKDRMPVLHSVPVDAAKKPLYMMFLTRIAYYTSAILAVEALGEPVFTVRRGNATFLKIYRLDGSRVTAQSLNSE